MLQGTSAGDDLVALGLRSAVQGLDGDDTLWAGGNLSRLEGGADDDTFCGFAFGATMAGGAGADRFLLGAGDERLLYGALAWGTDQVWGFTSGVDRIEMSNGLAFADLDIAVAPGTETAPPNWLVVAPDGSRIELYGVFDSAGFYAPLLEGDFLFGP